MYLLQIISFIIWLIVMICAMRDFKRTVLVWVPMSLLFNPQVCVTYRAPITALTVAVDLSLVLLYFFKCRGKYETYGFNKETYFFTPAVIIMVISYIMATLCSEMPFMSSFNKIVKQLIDYFGMTFILFRCINTKDDIMLFVRSLAISAFIFCIDGFVEEIVQENYWGDFIYYNSLCDDTTAGRGWHFPYSIVGQANMRFGMIRCYSVFALHLIFGFACCLVSYILFYMMDNKCKLVEKLSDKPNRMLYIGLLSMTLLGVVICNSKGPMICAVFILLTHFRLNQIFNLWAISAFCIGVIAVLYFFPDYIQNLLSLSDDDVAAEGGGSTLATRESQYKAAFELFARSPLFGNGLDAVKYYRKFGFEDILGAESIWLKLLPDQGLFGVVAYLFMYVIVYIDAKKYIPFNLWFYYLCAILIYDTTNGHSYDKLIWWLGIYIVMRRFFIIQKYSRA